MAMIACRRSGGRPERLLPNWTEKPLPIGDSIAKDIRGGRMIPLDLTSAAPWRRVCFTTYALSLSFFEAVMLDALLRGKGHDAPILADPEGIRAGLLARELRFDRLSAA
jgi:hypothetical protein